MRVTSDGHFAPTLEDLVADALAFIESFLPRCVAVSLITHEYDDGRLGIGLAVDTVPGKREGRAAFAVDDSPGWEKARARVLLEAPLDAMKGLIRADGGNVWLAVDDGVRLRINTIEALRHYMPDIAIPHLDAPGLTVVLNGKPLSDEDMRGERWGDERLAELAAEGAEPYTINRIKPRPH